MKSLGDKPNQDIVPSNVESLSKEEKKQVLFELVGKIVSKYTNIALPSEKSSSLQQALMVYRNMPRNFSRLLCCMRNLKTPSGRAMACVCYDAGSSCCSFSKQAIELTIILKHCFCWLSIIYFYHQDLPSS